jgi:hypothetical protein
MDPQYDDNTDAASSALIQHGSSTSRHGNYAADNEFGDGHDDASCQLSDADDDPSVVVTLVRNTTKRKPGVDAVFICAGNSCPMRLDSTLYHNQSAGLA